jgi:hypothetical protein
MVLCQLTLKRTGLRIETPARRWMEVFTCRASAMVRISLSWRYTLSTPSAEGAANVSRSTATVVTFWLALVKAGHGPPSRLMAGAMPLGRAWEVVRSTVTTRSVLSMGSR